MKQDDIYSKPLEVVKDFVFDKTVAEVFDDMINRSVPFYQEAQLSTALLVKRYASSNTKVYDLGCSTGTTLLELSNCLSDKSITLVGVDSSAAMLKQCKEKLQKYAPDKHIELQQAKLEDIEISSASVVILNWTLQFIPPENRSSVLKRIYNNLLHSGILLLSEKVKHDNKYSEKLFTDMYLDFKRNNSYSELEIAQKREALEQILIPLSISENIELLKQAGFSVVEVYLKFFNFACFLGVKA